MRFFHFILFQTIISFIGGVCVHHIKLTPLQGNKNNFLVHIKKETLIRFVPKPSIHFLSPSLHFILERSAFANSDLDHRSHSVHWPSHKSKHNKRTKSDSAHIYLIRIHPKQTIFSHIKSIITFTLRLILDTATADSSFHSDNVCSAIGTAHFWSRLFHVSRQI